MLCIMLCNVVVLLLQGYGTILTISILALHNLCKRDSFIARFVKIIGYGRQMGQQYLLPDNDHTVDLLDLYFA